MTTSLSIEAIEDELNAISISPATPHVYNTAATTFPFTRLPLDIRYLIYKYLLTFQDTRLLRPDSPSYTAWETTSTFVSTSASFSEAAAKWRSRLSRGCHPQILATCRSINREARDMLFLFNTMNIIVSDRDFGLGSIQTGCVYVNYIDLLNRTASTSPTIKLAHRFGKFKIVIAHIPELKLPITSVRVFGMAWIVGWLCEHVLAPCSHIVELGVHLDVAVESTDLTYHRYSSCAHQSLLYYLRRIDRKDSTLAYTRIIGPWSITQYLPREMDLYTHEQWLLRSFRPLRGVEKLVVIGRKVSEENIEDLRKVVLQPK